MPNYNFKNTNTGEEFTDFMSISAKEKYLEENPHIQQVLTSLNIVDPVNIGVTRPPSDFSKGVLGKVKEVAGAQSSAIDRRWPAVREW